MSWSRSVRAAGRSTGTPTCSRRAPASRRVTATCAAGRSAVPRMARRGRRGKAPSGARTQTSPSWACHRSRSTSRRTLSAGRSALCCTRSGSPPDSRHGRNGPHRSGPRAAGLRSGDAPRRGRDIGAPGAGRGRGYGQQWPTGGNEVATYSERMAACVKNSAICRVFSQYPRQESNLDPPLRRPTPLRTDRLDL